MSADSIREALRHGRLVTADQARDRVIAVARREVEVGPARQGSTGGGRRRLGVALTAVALLAAISFTPPGEAATAWMGRLVGIGEVGGPPTLEPQVGTPIADPLVIGNGRVSDGTSYEIVEYATEDEGLCFALSFPDPNMTRAGEICTQGQPTPRGLSGFGASFAGGNRVLPRFGWVDGVVDASTAAVRVRYETGNGRTGVANAKVVSPDRSLRRRIETGERTRFFVAFVPRGASPRAGGTMTLSAYDRQGRLLNREDTRRWTVPQR